MNKLKELRRERGMSQEELGAHLGVQKAAVCKYELGRVPLPHDVLVKLCDLFDVTADFLLGREGQVTPLFKKFSGMPDLFREAAGSVDVPLVGRVHAGLPMLADENITDYISVPASDVVAGEFFYMEVEGDCMEGEFIPEGALVLVRIQSDIENGRIAVIRIGDEVLLRKVKAVGSSLMLIPSNPKYEPLIVPRAEADIVGRVIECRIRNL